MLDRRDTPTVVVYDESIGAVYLCIYTLRVGNRIDRSDIKAARKLLESLVTITVDVASAPLVATIDAHLHETYTFGIPIPVVESGDIETTNVLANTLRYMREHHQDTVWLYDEHANYLVHRVYEGLLIVPGRGTSDDFMRNDVTWLIDRPNGYELLDNELAARFEGMIQLDRHMWLTRGGRVTVTNPERYASYRQHVRYERAWSCWIWLRSVENDSTD
jgi:hypothetical protein